MYELPGDRMLSVLYTLAVNDQIAYTTIQVDEDRVEVLNRQRARDRLEEAIWKRAEPEQPDRETWGLLPEHQAGLAAAMSYFGAPVG